jgi:hypothetical protein
MTENYPIVGDDAIMCDKKHGTSEKPVQKVKNKYFGFVRYIIYNIDFNPRLHERVSNHRDQKYIGEVSFWPAEYRN